MQFAVVLKRAFGKCDRVLAKLHRLPNSNRENVFLLKFGIKGESITVFCPSCWYLSSPSLGNLSCTEASKGTWLEVEDLNSQTPRGKARLGANGDKHQWGGGGWRGDDFLFARPTGNYIKGW